MKKLLAVVLSVAMAAMCFTACGEEEAKKEIFIGSTGPLTGDASSYGTSVNKGAILAVEEINKAGGLGGITLKFEMKDDKADAAEAATGYDALMDEGMQISIGSVTTGSCEAFAKRAVADKVFAITPSASGAAVIATGDNIFRICFGDPDQGIMAAEMLTEKYEKIGAIYDTSDTYSSGIYEAFEEKMADLGTEFTVRSFDKDNKKDFAAQVEALKDCDVIFLPIYYTEASLIASACAAKELDDIVLFGCDGLDGVASYVQGIKNPISYITPFDVNSTETVSANFVKNFKEKYGSEPDQFAADGYDAIYAIFNAMKAAGVNDASISCKDLCEKVVAAITDASFSMKGATGEMTWDKTGACTKVPIIVEVEK